MRPIDSYFATIKSGRSAWWHWLVGFAGIVILFFLPIMVIGFGIGLMAGLGLPDLELTSFSYFVLMLASFLPLFFGVWIVQKFWHQRSLTKLLTYTLKFRWRYLWNAMLATVLVYSGWNLVEYVINPTAFDDVILNPDFGLFLKGLIAVLILIPFQAASEEFMLRGYFNQSLIKYLKNPWLVFVITSAIFAWLHIWNSEAQGQEVPYLLAIFIFGFAACVLLYFEGGLESAIGFHIANNIFAFSIFGYEDPDLPNVALWNSGKPEIDYASTFLDGIAIAMVVLLTLWLNRRMTLRAAE